MEKTTTYINLRKVVHKFYCDHCGKEMTSTGHVFTTNPPQYQYICKSCNYQVTTRQNYPWSELVGDEINEKGISITI